MHKSLFLISLALSSAACSQSGSDAAAPVEAMNARADTPPTPQPPEVPAAKATNFEDNSEVTQGLETEYEHAIIKPGPCSEAANNGVDPSTFQTLDQLSTNPPASL